MKKLLTFLLIIIVASLIAGVYGILHDQLTYTISSEYYTKFKFYQFKLAHVGDEALFPNPRIQVSIVGFMATWWVGLFIGLILGLVGLIHQDNMRMFNVTISALIRVLIITFIFGFLGLAYGKYYLATQGVSWWLPDNLVDTKNFIAVGSMHNFGYLGGLIGLVAGIIFSVRQKRKVIM